MALPEASCDAAYATDGYSSSVQNLASISLDSDNVFADGVQLQTPTMSGSVASGFKAALSVTV